MPRPTSIKLDRGRGLLIVPWDDGHVSEYPLAGLREACPCAECRGGHENMGKPADPSVFDVIPLTRAKSYVLERVLPVGNYAIQPEWDDGHHTGIYTWPYLRALCPCPICRAERAAQP
jgi:DUF971 family protein